MHCKESLSSVNCCVSPSVGNWGPHLVVVRSCNILKWELELKRWCPGLKILLYFGSQRELRAKRQVLYFAALTLLPKTFSCIYLYVPSMVM